MTDHPHSICPCCGSPVNAGGVPISALLDAPLPTVARSIIMTLADAYPRSVTPEFLIERIYSGTREPEWARTALNVQISRLRDKLAIYGWTIPRGPMGRGNRARYKLEPLS